MKKVIDILRTNKMWKSKVEKWLALEEDQEEQCPFSNVYVPLTESRCETVCTQLFPRCARHKGINGTFLRCPCRVYTLKYVKQIARQIVAGKFDGEGVKE